ncbi:MAG TPA: serine/threonine-protein kinase [Polyangiaceae bacterium]|nr:serine/threonine-protein kinase [Polyangiaceae bacterium]
MDFEVGQLLGGKYRIVRRIGVGGMGSVYEARHAGLGTPVALKVLLPQLAKVPTVADRFRREAQVAAKLESAHVIHVTDVDQLPDGRPYLVMELLEGVSMQEHLEQAKALSREEAVDLGLQILLGLECAHALGVVHRDLKPGNVFLDTRGVGRSVKILDFGVAKVKATPEFQALTRPGMVMGTPEYMAPEQAFSADQADARSDLFSVGVMLYEMLSGALPAQGDVPLAVAHQVMTRKVRPLGERCPGLPQGLLNLVQRAMEPERSERFQSALEMRRALSAFAGELSVAGRVAASVALGQRPASAPSGPAGTEKVVAMTPLEVGAAAAQHATRTAGASRPASDTGEMSHFRELPPRAAGGPPVVPANGAPATAAAAPVALGRRPPAPTAEMPAVEAPAHAMPAAPRRIPPTLPTPERPPPPPLARAGVARSIAIGVLCLAGLATVAIGGLWLASEAGWVRLYPDPGPPPPMPQPQGNLRSVPRPAPKP